MLLQWGFEVTCGRDGGRGGRGGGGGECVGGGRGAEGCGVTSGGGSYQIDPTTRDIPQNYKGIEALEPYQSDVHFARRLSSFELGSELISN